MPTGACGINCEICKLNLLGICSSCGAGKSLVAQKKLAAQVRLLGDTCPILSCARLNCKDYCLRDCNQFPCENFSSGPYPFSEGYLMMQERRRQELPPAFSPTQNAVEVPNAYWNDLQNKDLHTLANLTLFDPMSAKKLCFRFLNEDIVIDVEARCLKRQFQDSWQPSNDPLLTLVTLVYLLNVKEIFALKNDIVGVKDLKEGHFFRGPHELKTRALVERYENDIAGFIEAAEHLAGEPVDMADAAFKLWPFPRVPLYYLFWTGDDEFKASVSVLFDRSIEKVLAADAIWALVNRVTTALLLGPPAK
jgi:hypothetical protein